MMWLILWFAASVAFLAPFMLSSQISREEEAAEAHRKEAK